MKSSFNSFIFDDQATQTAGGDTLVVDNPVQQTPNPQPASPVVDKPITDGGLSTATTKVALADDDFTKLINANKAQSTTSKSRIVEVIVKAINDWRPTSTGLPVMMVVTDMGNYWPLANGVKNLPNSIPAKGLKAQAVLTLNVDKSGAQRLNMTSLTFEGLDVNTSSMINQAANKGFALFQSK